MQQVNLVKLFYMLLPTWAEIMDIINILIRCEFAYHVEFGFICEYSIVLCDVVNCKLCELGWSFAT